MHGSSRDQLKISRQRWHWSCSRTTASFVWASEASGKQFGGAVPLMYNLHDQNIYMLKIIWLRFCMEQDYFEHVHICQSLAYTNGKNKRGYLNIWDIVGNINLKDPQQMSWKHCALIWCSVSLSSTLDRVPEPSLCGDPWRIIHKLSCVLHREKKKKKTIVNCRKVFSNGDTPFLHDPCTDLFEKLQEPTWSTLSFTL